MNIRRVIGRYKYLNGAIVIFVFLAIYSGYSIYQTKELKKTLNKR